MSASEETTAQLTQQIVTASTLLGINIVQTIAAESLKAKPGLSLRDFTHILDQYVDSVQIGN